MGYNRAIMASPSFSFEDAFDTAEQEVSREKIERYRQEIGKFLEPPYIFDLPATKERLRDCYPDNYYMCRNNNRTAAAGFIEQAMNDPAVKLSEKQRDALRNDHDFIISLPRDVWRTEEEMRHMRFAVEESCRIISSL
jgi:hypothetical protein